MSIVIVGNTGTGKTTIGNLLSKKFGFAVYEIGIFVKKLYIEELSAINKLEYESHNILTCSTDFLLNKQIMYFRDIIQAHRKDYLTEQRLTYVNQLIRTHGKEYFISQLMQSIDNENIIIIGARSVNEIDFLKRRLRFPFFVGLTCEMDILTKRFIFREKDYMYPMNARKIFEKRTDTELLWGVDNILNYCNIILPTENISPYDAVSLILETYKEFYAENIKKNKGVTE